MQSKTASAMSIMPPIMAKISGSLFFFWFFSGVWPAFMVVETVGAFGSAGVVTGAADAVMFPAVGAISLIGVGLLMLAGSAVVVVVSVVGIVGTLGSAGVATGAAGLVGAVGLGVAGSIGVMCGCDCGDGVAPGAAACGILLSIVSFVPNLGEDVFISANILCFVA